MDGEAYLADVRRELRRLKALADAAVAQTPPGDLFRTLGGDENSLGLLMKHVAGNQRSRWRDFLASDGEKPDRRRDAEFEREPGDDGPAIRAAWEKGWSTLLATLGALRPEDLGRTVTIRGEAHTVLQAIQRQLSHYAYHVGEIVLLARHWSGPAWRSLSIPRAASERFSREPRPYLGEESS